MDRRTVEFGYRFHPDHHGYGFATESCRALLRFLFEEVKVRKVIALCTEANSASYRVMERLGMQREALYRAYLARIASSVALAPTPGRSPNPTLAYFLAFGASCSY